MGSYRRVMTSLLYVRCAAARRRFLARERAPNLSESREGAEHLRMIGREMADDHIGEAHGGERAESLRDLRHGAGDEGLRVEPAIPLGDRGIERPLRLVRRLAD